MRNVIIVFVALLFFTDLAAQESPLLMQDSSFLNSFDFRCIGPTRGGRVTAVGGDAQNDRTYYMGATGGGVWKTTNAGHSWKCISDGYFETPSIGAIHVVASNPKRIYVGTGTDGLRSNIIVGKGMYRSDDEGKTWSKIGLEKTGHIGSVVVHPENEDEVLVAAIGNAFMPTADRGVYKSIDAGKSWQKTLFISDSTGVADLEYHPTNPDIVYAALWQAERKPWTIKSGGSQGGIYKSMDGGDTWNKLKGGLPIGTIGKIDLAVSMSEPDKVVALIEAPVGKGGVYVSTDAGKNWSLESTKKELLDRPFYYCNIDLNPQNANTMYVNATRFWRSRDNGKTWQRVRTPHGDNHDMWINPSDSLNFVQGNDGGGNVTFDEGKSWSSIENQATAELYQVAVDDQDPYWLYAGQQDNSTISLPSLPAFNPTSDYRAFWTAVGGCETGPAVPKPGNPDIVYSNCKGRFGVYNKKTGQERQYYVGASNMYGHNPNELKYRFQRVSPIHISPHNPDKVYHCSQYVHVTTTDGETWETVSPDLTAFKPETQVISGYPITRDITGEEFHSTIYAIQESKLQKGQIWVGANDGPVHVTINNGATWEDVTPKELPGGGRIDCVEPSSHNAQKAYFTSLRYQLGDPRPYIFKTGDGGKTWTKITTGIPDDFPVRVVREDPKRAGLLYAGTEYGLFVSFDDGANWQSFQNNIPVTPITDIKIYRNNINLSTMGRSFWILDDISPLRKVAKDQMAAQKHILFEPLDTYMKRYRTRGMSQVPAYPSAGVLISYYLADTVRGPIQIDIEDASGAIIRSFSHMGKDIEDSTKEEDMATGERKRGGDSKIKIAPGFHRFRWDMRHTGPWDKKTQRAKGSGPRVSPDAYKLTLNAPKFTQSTNINLLPDQKVVMNGVKMHDLAKQETLLLRIQTLTNDARILEYKVSEEIETLDKKLVENPEQKKLVERKALLQSVTDELKMAKGRYMKPMLLEQINYLRSMLSRADQLPGKDAYDRYDELKNTFQALSKKAGVNVRS